MRPTTVRELANLEAEEQRGYLSGALLASLQPGDIFTVGRTNYKVTRITKPIRKSYEERPGHHEAGEYTKRTVYLEREHGKKMSYELWDDWIQGGERMLPAVLGKGQTRNADPVGQLSRDIEGDITVDLINEYNPFHTPSHSFNRIRSLLQTI